jgi:EAL domain-containing protein (putative c-di-GMP-specific phosphodiesterase class I)/FixJ family two-component response regulator
LSPRSAPPLATAVPSALAEATVLIVDDEETNVTLLERTLRSSGVARVHGITDPRQVVPRCLDEEPDLILLDLHMPHLNGYQVMEALQAALPAGTFLPILVLTSDATDDARERALDAGAKDFLTKPFNRVETIQRITNLLETRALFRTVQRHNAELRAELDRRTEVERRHVAEHHERYTRIERVLTQGSLAMVFQPITDLRTGAVVGVEALARVDSEPRRPPNEWFDEAAGVNLGNALELAAVTTALGQLDRLPPTVFMSVNVSPAAAASADLREVLQRLPSTQIVVELTEHTPVADYEPLVAALSPIRSDGVRIAVDDAGAGYAGFQHILKLEPDIIKLDLDLTRGIHSDPARRALAGALVNFADEISATIVAEGIETADDLSALRALGVPWGQGYHLARPQALPLDPLPSGS